MCISVLNETLITVCTGNTDRLSGKMFQTSVHTKTTTLLGQTQHRMELEILSNVNMGM